MVDTDIEIYLPLYHVRKTNCILIFVFKTLTLFFINSVLHWYAQTVSLNDSKMKVEYRNPIVRFMLRWNMTSLEH